MPSIQAISSPNLFANKCLARPQADKKQEEPQNINADFNNDGAVDFFDYDDYVGAYEAKKTSADLNHDGQSDRADYDLFVKAFEKPNNGTDTAQQKINADFDHDGTVDFFDYDAYVGALEAKKASADLNHDGKSDRTDYDLFVKAFQNPQSDPALASAVSLTKVATDIPVKSANIITATNTYNPKGISNAQLAKPTPAIVPAGTKSDGLLSMFDYSGFSAALKKGNDTVDLSGAWQANMADGSKVAKRKLVA